MIPVFFAYFALMSMAAAVLTVAKKIQCTADWLCLALLCTYPAYSSCSMPNSSGPSKSWCMRAPFSSSTCSC